MTSNLRGSGEGYGKNEMLSDAETKGTGGSGCSGRPIYIFFIKENLIWTMTEHHPGSNNVLLTRNLLIDSGVRQ